jgi:transposase
VEEKRRRRTYTQEFKDEFVALVQSSNKSVAQISRDMDLADTAVHRWVKQAEIDAAKRDRLTRDEREELNRLRREVRDLKEERAIYKKAMVFFARETR